MTKIFEVAIVGHFPDNTQTITTYHYRSEPPIANRDYTAAEVIDAVGDLWLTEYLACMASSWTIDAVEATEMLPASSTDDPEQAINTGYGPSGTRDPGDHELPIPLCAILAKKSGVAARWANGYIALPSPLNTNAIDDYGTLSTGYLTDLTALKNFLPNEDARTFDGGVDETSLIPVVYSRTRHNANIDPWYAQIESVVIRPRFRWRRSRTTSP